MKEILFITRKRWGTGGMQRYSRDLRRGLLQMPDVRLRRAMGVLTALRRGAHIHLGDALLAPLGWVVKCITRSRVTLTAHGLDLVFPLRPYQWLLGRTLPALDTIVCVSHATAREAQRLGVAPERIRIIPPGIWPEESCTESPHALFRREGDGPVLMTVGRLRPRKGIAWFIAEVLPLLLRDFPNLKYTIIGSGKEEYTIKKIIHERGLEPVVFLRGFLRDAERDAAYASADLFVMPNVPEPGDREGFGIVCIEASARGTPVAAARIEGVCDAVREGETGNFFRPGDAADAARVIRRMLRSPLDRAAVARSAIEHYSWHALLPRYRHEVFRV